MFWRIAVLVIATLPLAAGAQSYRCIGKDGKKYYGQSVPPQCVGQVVEQLNAQGAVVKRIDAQASADERAKKEADEAEAKKRAAAAKEQGRRDQALLATYSSEKEVDDARGRALEANRKQVQDLEARLAELRKSKAADAQVKTQEEMLAAKKKEAAAINARYDDEKKRYAELTKRGK